MRLIKRYSNRKLYDTALRRYITLDGVAALVVAGEEIKVVDNDSEEDLTSVILSQILLERERVQRFVPSAVLSQILRGGENLSRNLGKVARPFTTAPTLPLPQFLEQEVDKSLKFWAEIGQNGEEETLHLLESLIEKRRRARTEVEPRHAPRFGLSLDKFEEWSDPELAVSEALPRDLIAACAEAAQDLAFSLTQYNQGENSLGQEETELFQHRLGNSRTRLNALLEELDRLIQP